MALITNCTLSSKGCTAGGVAIGFDDGPCLIRLVGSSVACGHCNEVVYPDLVTLSEHTIRCEQEVVIWYSRGLNVEVHRCNQPSALVDVEQFLDLAVPA